MRRTVLFFVYCLLAAGLAAQGHGQQMLQEMAQAARKIQTIEADFTQTRHSRMMKAAQVSQGKMLCRQPDLLRWEYTKPRRSTLILEAGEARLLGEDGRKAGRANFAGSLARMIMNSVAGKSLTDSTAFQVTVEEKAGEYEATLLPLRKEMKRMYDRLILHFDTRQSTVTRIELYEKSGDRTDIQLHDIRINGN